MPPYFVAFLDKLKTLRHDISRWQFSDAIPPTLTLAAQHPSVGPLVLFDEETELTLEFGTKYHSHFGDFEEATCEDERMLIAANSAAEFVDRILREKIGVAVHFAESGGCTGASLIYLDDLGISAKKLAASTAGIYGGSIRTERFLWTGPITNPK